MKHIKNTDNEKYLANQKRIKDAGLVLVHKKYGEGLYICKSCNNRMWLKRKQVIQNPRCRQCKMGASFGEDAVISVLIANNIRFEKEKTFKGLKGTKEGSLRFDFYIYGLNRNFIIEVDGVQHRKNNKSNNKSNWGEDTRIHDKIKDEYCKKNEITIYRLPYKTGKVDTLKSKLKYVLSLEHMHINT